MRKNYVMENKYETYKILEFKDDFSSADFISIGKNGPTKKRIKFTAEESSVIVSLAFGDIDEKGKINDTAVSDNGDRNKILATVAAVTREYLYKYPDRWVYFKGSTPSRMRLYRMQFL